MVFNARATGRTSVVNTSLQPVLGVLLHHHIVQRRVRHKAVLQYSSKTLLPLTDSDLVVMLRLLEHFPLCVGCGTPSGLGQSY